MAPPPSLRRLTECFSRLTQCTIVRSALYILMGAWLILQDPFGISTATDRAISDAYASTLTRLFPVNYPPLTVIQIDESGLEALHQSGRFSSQDWPILYQEHASILTRIASLSHRPQAVFLDVFFQYPRATSGDIAALGQRIDLIQRTTDMHLLLAGGGENMPMSDASRNALGAAELVPTTWRGHDARYPLYSPSNSSLQAGIEPVFPAYRLYQLYCQAANSCEPDSLSESGMPQEIVYQWPAGSRERLAGNTGDECPSDNVLIGGAQAIAEIVYSIARGLGFSEGASPLPASCMPIHVVSVADLFTSNTVSLAPPGLEPDAAYVVMLGVAIPSEGDFHGTAVFQRIAGVFLHAVAFENLIRFEADVIRFADLSWLSVTLWAVISVVLPLVIAQRIRNGCTPLPLGFWKGWFATFLVVVLLQVVFQYVFRLSLDGWLSMIAMLPLLRQVLVNRELSFHQINCRSTN